MPPRQGVPVLGRTKVIVLSILSAEERAPGGADLFMKIYGLDARDAADAL